MIMRTSSMALKMLIYVLCGLLAAPAGILAAAAPQSTTEIEHKAPGKPYLPGRRIVLEAEIEDNQGVLAARCYFRTQGRETFTFVPMQTQGGDDYRGILPAPWIGSASIEYKFLVINQQKQVTLSQSFFIQEKELEETVTWQEPGEMKMIRIDKVQEAVEQYEAMKQLIEDNYRRKYPDYQQKADTNILETQLELQELADGMQGFYDTFVVTQTPEPFRYGLVADGLYTSSQVATAGGSAAATAATGATSAGTVAASSGGGAAGIIIGAVALGAVGAGVYAGAEALSEDDEDDGPVSVANATAADFVGTYSVRDSSRAEWSGRFTFNSGGTGSYTETISGTSYNGRLVWSYDQGSQTLTFNDADGGGGASGRVAGNTDNFSINGHYANGRPATFVFTRD